MSVTVKIPAPLRPLVGGKSEVQLEGTTVGEVMGQLEAQHKGFGERVLDGTSVKRFINIYVNEDNIRDQKELDTPVKSGDTISILPSIAGGTDITKYDPGTFCWPELSTADQAGAKKFYAALFGWEIVDQPIGPAQVYTMFQLGGKPVGAAKQMEPSLQSAGIPSHWLSYISVADADKTIDTAKSLGGSAIVGPFEAMDAGRMGILMDPTGAPFAVWQGRKHIGALVLDQPGSLAWTELLSTNADITRDFYSKLFGWGLQLHEMGPMKYTVFLRGETPAAGMMQTTPDMGKVPSHWLPYFASDNVDGTAARTTELGGKVLMAPADIPNVGRFAVLQDPQLATFGVLRFLPRDAAK